MTVLGKKRILIVDDEAAIREMVKFVLDRADFICDEAADAQEAIQRIAENHPDLLLLDWMLPGMSGLDLARRLSKDEYTRDIPIIMLTARSEEEDRVRGLEGGADDYISKPFSPRELVARIRAVLRRSSGTDNDEMLLVQDLVLDGMSHRVTVKGKELNLGPTEFRLLRFFMGHPERVYARAQLLDHVWGHDAYVEERTVDVHIRRLRKVLEETGQDKFIQTVRGVGYRFSTQAQTQD